MGIASIKYFLRQRFSVYGFLDSSQQTSIFILNISHRFEI